jgi:ATP-binding cassette subfamily B (MDR/TAP) protein 1
VGPSGSGKSTIVGLIEGWYTLHDQYVIAKAVEKDKKKADKKKKKKKSEDDDEDDDEDAAAIPLDGEDLGPPVELKGSISTCGNQLGDIDIKWWRSQIGLVQQEPFLFNPHPSPARPNACVTGTFTPTLSSTDVPIGAPPSGRSSPEATP